jgi:hypothetical protein
MVSDQLQGLGQWLVFHPVVHSVWTIVSHVRGRVKSPTLPMYAWVVDFISSKQTSPPKMPFEEE